MDDIFPNPESVYAIPSMDPCDVKDHIMVDYLSTKVPWIRPRKT